MCSQIWCCKAEDCAEVKYGLHEVDAVMLPCLQTRTTARFSARNDRDHSADSASLDLASGHNRWIFPFACLPLRCRCVSEISLLRAEMSTLSS